MTNVKEQFVEELFAFIVDSGKVAKVKFGKDELLGYNNTIDYINNLAGDRNSLVVGDERYLISDYKIVEGFDKLILPSKVLMADSKLAFDIMSRTKLDVEIMTPDEFERMSIKILGAFKAPATKIKPIERKPVFLHEVLDRVVINGEVRKEACAPIRVNLNLDDAFDVDFTVYSEKKALMALIKQVLLAL